MTDTSIIVDEIFGDSLTEKQELFCQYYTQVASSFGNATLSYSLAYGYDLDTAPDDDYIEEKLEDGTYKLTKPSTKKRYENICAVNGSRLLRNTKIDKRVRTLLNDLMDEKIIDARLVEIIMKGEDKDSIQAIKEFNKLKQRIVEKKDITSGGQAITIEFAPIFKQNATTPPETVGDNPIESKV